VTSHAHSPMTRVLLVMMALVSLTWWSAVAMERHEQALAT
jgi:hypothetical protein